MTIYTGDIFKHVFVWMNGFLRQNHERLHDKLWIYLLLVYLNCLFVLQNLLPRNFTDVSVPAILRGTFVHPCDVSANVVQSESVKFEKVGNKKCLTTLWLMQQHYIFSLMGHRKCFKKNYSNLRIGILLLPLLLPTFLVGKSHQPCIYS